MIESRFNKHVFSVTLGVGLTALTYAVGFQFEWIKEFSWLEAFAVFTSYWCTFLCVLQSRDNYPIGAISVAALCVLFYQQNLLSSMVLQVYLFGVLLYGWFRWGPDKSTRRVTRLGMNWWTAGYGAITLVVYLITNSIANYFGAAVAGWDAAILVLSILAQFLLDNKKLENWAVWIVVNVISVFLYWSQDLKVVAVQMGLFLINAIWGWYMWNKSQNEFVGDQLGE